MCYAMSLRKNLDAVMIPIADATTSSHTASRAIGSSPTVGSSSTRERQVDTCISP